MTNESITKKHTCLKKRINFVHIVTRNLINAYYVEILCILRCSQIIKPCTFYLNIYIGPFPI